MDEFEARVRRLELEIKGGTELTVCDALLQLSFIKLESLADNEQRRRDVLKVRNVGKIVGNLRKHKDKEISEFATAIVGKWKVACGIQRDASQGSSPSPRSPTKAARRSFTADGASAAASMELAALPPIHPPPAPVSDAPLPPAGEEVDDAPDAYAARATSAEAPPTSAEPPPAAPAEAPPAANGPNAADTPTPTDAPPPADATPPADVPPPQAEAASAAAPTVGELTGVLAANCAAGKGTWGTRHSRVPLGALVFGAPLYSGRRPSLGDFGVGVVTRAPTPLDPHWELRVLYREPIGGAPVELREKVQFGKERMLDGRFLLLRVPGDEAAESGDVPAGAHALPSPYTAADVALLRRGLGPSGRATAIVPGSSDAAAIEQAGFAIYGAHGASKYW